MDLLKHQNGNKNITELGEDFAGFAGNALTNIHFTKTWILDTGANNHMCCNKSLFISMTELHKSHSVILPDKHLVDVRFIGDVQICSEILLKGLLFVPRFKCNLLSIGKMARDLQCIVVFTPQVCLMQAKHMKKPMILGRNHKDLYFMENTGTADKSTTTTPFNNDSFISCLANASIWHLRLGHLPLYKLKTLSFVRIDNTDVNMPCEICAKAR